MKQILLIVFLIIAFVETHSQKLDTTKAIILTCDTSLRQKTGITIWQYGYEVERTEIVTTENLYGNLYRSVEPYKKSVHLQWLDANKIPISKNIVIWLFKKLSNEKTQL